MFRKILIRDLALLALTLAAWLWLPTAEPAGPWAIAGLTLLCAFLFHEWGHWLGARWSAATIYPPKHLFSGFLYNFDAQRNSRRQFLTTSVAGFVATGLFLLLFFFALADTHPATPLIRTGAGVLAGLTVIFEFPIAIAVALGKPVPALALFSDNRDQLQAAGPPPADQVK